MFDNIAFSFFGISIYWYGLVYFFGFLIAYLTLLKLDKYSKSKKRSFRGNIFIYFNFWTYWSKSISYNFLQSNFLYSKSNRDNFCK